MTGPGGDRAAHQRWHDDLAAYALGSLGSDEAAELERHLTGCEDCRERLEWLSPAVGALAESVPRVEPPPDLKRRIMADVGGSEARPAPEAPGTSRRGWLLGFALRPAAALAAVAILAAGIGGYALRGGDGTVTEPQQVEGGVAATLEHDDGAGTLRLTGLRQLDSDHLYQAWIERDRAVVPSSLFAPQPDGTASAAIPGGLDGADRVMVTVEPRRGSKVPSTAPLISVPLS